MRKNKLFILLLIVTLVTAVFAACTDNSEPDGTGVEIVGAVDLYLKKGDGTDAKLLENVEAVLPDGSKVQPTLRKDGYDANVAGKYLITYAYGSAKASANVYVYDMPKIYLEDKEIMSDSIEITFRQANSSYDFIKGIKVLDSFGVSLDFEKSASSDVFAQVAGEYNVTYSARDVAGNVLDKNVKYIVTVGNSPEISGGSYGFDANGCKIPCDLKGETDGLLYDDGALVDPNCYGFDQDNLILTPEYSVKNAGEHDYKLETSEGITEFKVTIVDEGNPLFDIDKLEGATYLYGAAYSVLPTDIRPDSSGYAYSYTLKNSKGEICNATENEKGLEFLTAENKSLQPDDYTLKVNATATNGQTSQKEYGFSVIYPYLSSGEKSSITAVTLDETVYGVTDALKFEKSSGSTAWDGRIAFVTPADAYSIISLNIYIEYCNKQTDDGKANVALAAYVDGDYTRIVSCMDKATGEIVNTDDMLTGRWYTIMIDANSKSNNAYLYFFIGGDSAEYREVRGYISDFKVELKDGLKNAVVFKNFGNESGKVAARYEDGELVTIGYSNAQWNQRLSFADAVWASYLQAQEGGGKVMSMNIKFETSVSLVGYYFTNGTKDLKPYIGNIKYFRFYDDSDNLILYNSLVKDVWYKLIVDIDAIKTDLGELGTRGDESGLIFSRETEGALLIKNVEFTDIGEYTVSEDKTVHAQTPSYLTESDGVYTLTKNAGQQSSGSTGGAYNTNVFYIRNALNASTLNFKIKFVSAPYFSPCTSAGPGSSTPTFSNISDKVTMYYAEGENAGQEYTLNLPAGRTDYTLIEQGVWYDVTIDVTGVYDLVLHCWNMSNTGSIQVKDISFS